MCMSTQLGQNIYRILLYRNNATDLLLETTPAGLRLPAASIPAHSRVSLQVTAWTKSSWNIQVYCLFRLRDGGPAHAPVHYQIAEIYGPEKDVPPGMQWFRALSLAIDAFNDRQDFEAIQNSLTMLDQYRRGELSGAFGKPGWLEMVTEWVNEQARGAGVSLTGQFRQFNAGPAFSLLRFETNGTALWFKAVGEPNVREFPITCTLAKLLAAHVPPMVATRPDWNAWLTTEVAGAHPDANSGVETWIAVARTLAELQVASHGKSLHLVHVGCHDTRIRTLAELVDPFLEVVAALMEQQIKTSPSRLSAAELLALGSQMHKIFSQLAQSDFPNTLSHLDLHPGNILVSRSECAFLDWAEACVGYPLVAFQYLLEHLRKLQPTQAWEAQLASAYSEAWRPLVGLQTFSEAMRVSPLLAVFTCAVAGGTWCDPSSRSRPEIAALLRSLTRRMKREVDALAERSTVCAS